MLDAPPSSPTFYLWRCRTWLHIKCSKLSGHHQHQIKHTQLFAVVENSRALVNNARSQKSIALATPSSVNWSTSYNQRSAARAKKQLKQPVANVSKENMTSIPEMPPIQM